MKIKSPAIIAISAVVAVLTVLASTAFGSYQTVTLGNYNVSLDFQGTQVKVAPQPNRSDADTIVWTTTFKGSSKNDYAAAFIFDYDRTQALDLEDRLWKFMKGYCTMTDTDEGTVCGRPGYIATGYARVEHGFGKQVCYSGIATMPEGGKGGKDFIILAHFENATLNEHVVRTAKIEYAGDMVRL